MVFALRNKRRNVFVLFFGVLADIFSRFCSGFFAFGASAGRPNDERLILSSELSENGCVKQRRRETNLKWIVRRLIREERNPRLGSGEESPFYIYVHVAISEAKHFFF